MNRFNVRQQAFKEDWKFIKSFPIVFWAASLLLTLVIGMLMMISYRSLSINSLTDTLAAYNQQAIESFVGEVETERDAFETLATDSASISAIFDNYRLSNESVSLALVSGDNRIHYSSQQRAVFESLLAEYGNELLDQKALLVQAGNNQDLLVTSLALIDSGALHIIAFQDLTIAKQALYQNSSMLVALLLLGVLAIFLSAYLLIIPVYRLIQRQYQRNEQLLAAIDAMPQGIVLASSEMNQNRVLFSNRAAADLLSQGEVFTELYLDELIPENAEVTGFDHKEGKPLIYQWKDQTTEGETIWKELMLGSSSLSQGSTAKDILVGVVGDVTQRVDADQINHRLAASVSYSGDAIEICDIQGRYLYVNKAFEQMFGYKFEDIEGRTPAQVFEKSVQKESEFFDEIWHQLCVGEKWQGTYQAISRSGKVLDLDVSVFPILDARGQIESIVAIKKNISDVVSERNQNARLSVAIEQSSSMVMITDTRGVIEYVNPSFCQVTGFSSDMVLGKTPSLFKSPETSSKTVWSIWDALSKGKIWRGEMQNLKADGSSYWEQQTISPIRSQEGDIVSYVAIKEDISERKRTEAQLLYQAVHDDLTSLYNRAAFQQQIKTQIANTVRTGESGALLIIDVDGFKEINEALGHQGGDQLLVQFARRLQEFQKDSDVVARLSGDEFSFFVANIQDEKNAAHFVSQMLQTVNQPFYYDGKSLDITASAGIAMVPADGENVDELLHHADLALFRSKETGLGSFNFYATEMDDEIQRFKMLAASMGRALRHNEFELFYQPVITEQGPQAVEALVRWNDPDAGLISPADFIPVAEQTRMIIPLGLWVIEQACQQIKAWLDEGLRVSVAVNLSAVQFQDGDLDDHIKRLVRQSDIPPELLHLEVTESMAIENHNEVIRVLKEMRNMGMEVLLDDFGTGYSSLHQLRKLPIDRLKIDRSFLQDISPEYVDLSVIKAIVQLGESLGLEVTVEGVETEFQLQVLTDLGCTDFQGFYFARPAPAKVVTSYIKGEQAVLKKGQ